MRTIFFSQWRPMEKNGFAADFFKFECFIGTQTFLCVLDMKLRWCVDLVNYTKVLGMLYSLQNRLGYRKNAAFVQLSEM